MKDLGRVPDGTGLSQAEPVARLGPPGVDPSRVALTHYSKAPILAVESREQLDRDTWRGKPSGLWVSADGEDDWLSWCEGEQWGLDRFAYAHPIRLKPDANILVVDTLEGFDAFVRQYRAPESRRSRAQIDWHWVRHNHGGMVIAPYRWERRFEDWYYGWDCASGCIWDASQVATVGAAIAMEARQGGDGETRLHAKHDSAGPQDIAPPIGDQSYKERGL